MSIDGDGVVTNWRSRDVVDAGRDEVREHVVLVARDDQAADRHADPLGVVGAEDVAEVARGDAHVDRLAGDDAARGHHVRVRADVVDDLRQQPAPVDGVGAGELQPVLLGRARSANAASLKAALTALWQSSKLPRTPNTPTLSPCCVTICLRWMSETPSAG